MLILHSAALLAAFSLPACAVNGADASASSTASATAGEAILVTFSDRPPYMIPGPNEGDAPAGLTGTPTANAFRHAGIVVTWSILPPNRQLLMLKDPARHTCSIGWFRTAEREQFGKFTRPIYRDKDWMVLGNASFAAHGDATLEAALQRPETRVLVKDNYSYGELDQVLDRLKPVKAISTASIRKMAQSVGKGAVDLMFVSEDEGNYLLAHAGANAGNLRLLRFKDMPHGPERHILCGRGVPDDVINRLNKAIAQK